MTALFKLIIILLIAIIIGALVRSGPGHIILFIETYRIDLSLTTFILIDLLLFGVFYCVIRFWVTLQKLANKVDHK